LSISVQIFRLGLGLALVGALDEAGVRQLGGDRRDLGVVGGSLRVERDAAVGHRGDAAEVRGHHGEGGLAVLDRVFGLGELGGGGNATPAPAIATTAIHSDGT
jgi:hypothetical protein